MKFFLETRILAAVALVVLPSCFSLAPDPPPPTRWLSIMPETVRAGTDSSGAKIIEPTNPNVRVGSVSSSDAITDQLISRVSEVELTYAEFVRWAEPPTVMVQRMLGDELFERQGFISDTGADRRLDVKIIAFEEHLMPRREGRIVVVARLSDAAGQALFRRRFSASIPVDGEDPALVAEALKDGIQQVVQEIGELMALR